MYKLEYDNPSATYSTQIRIAKADVNLVDYDHGYQHSFSHSIVLWDKQMDKYMLSGAQDNDVRAGIIAYAQQ